MKKKLLPLMVVLFILSLSMITTINVYGLSNSGGSPQAPALTITTTTSVSGVLTEIVVQVTDQNGLWYNGVQVQIWQQEGALLYTGTIQNGFYSSGNLTTDSNYTVIVSSGFQTENETVYLGTTNAFVSFVLTRPSNPQIYVAATTFTPSVISPGSTFVATIAVQSLSGSAYDSLVSFNSSSPAGVSISGTGSVFALGTIPLNTSNIFSATFIVQSTAANGIYQIPYVLSYENVTGAQFSTNGFITVPITGVPSRPELIVSTVNFDPSIISPGSIFTTNVSISNTGTQAAYASSIVIAAPAQSISLVGSTGEFNLGTLQPNQTEVVSFEMVSQASAQTGTVSVPFTLLYNNNIGTLFNSNGNFTVALSATPDLEVGSFSLSSASLVPGGTSTLTMSVINIGGDSAYDATLELTGSQFLSLNSSNYLGAIPSGGIGKAVFSLTVDNETAPGTYNFTVLMSYEDGQGNSYESNSSYSVSVSPYPSPDVSITNILLDPPVISGGTSGSITLFFENFGSTAAENVTIQVIGGDGIVSSNYFGLGTISPGGQVTQVIGMNVAPKIASGNYTLQFTVTYNDATGKTYHSSVPMAISIYGASSLFTTEDILLVAGVVVAAVASFLYLRRHQVVHEEHVWVPASAPTNR